MKLNIGLFSDSFPPRSDEAARSVFACAEHINAELGHCFVVTPKVSDYIDRTPYNVVRVRSLRMPKKWDSHLPLPAGKKLFSGLMEREPDLLHVHNPYVMCRRARRLRELMQIPMIVSVHERCSDTLDRIFTKGFTREYARKYIVQNLESADEVWVDSHALAADIRTLGYTGGFVRQSVGCDLSDEPVTDEWRAVVEKLHKLERSSVLLLCVCRLDREDKFLLRAMCYLRDIEWSPSLVIIGDGPAREAWENSIKELKLEDVVHIVPRPAEEELMRAYYNRASLLLCPWTDSLSSVREASALNCPAVMFSDDCIADGFQDGINSFLTGSDPVLLTEDITGILSSRERLAKIGQKAHDTFYVPGSVAARAIWSRYEMVCRLNAEHKEETAREKEYA